MNRRSFFRTMIGGVATAAAVQAFPFRVFSFPSEIAPATTFPALLAPNLNTLSTVYYDRAALDVLVKTLRFADVRPRNGLFLGYAHPMQFKRYQKFLA